jgi:hypothetical protein
LFAPLWIVIAEGVSNMDDDASALEEYLRTAEIDLYGTFAATAGGGHPSKEFVLVRGGIGALAKLATTDDEARQCKSEVGAYVLAHVLGWDDLVPVTVFREVPTSEGLVSASVQILWPAFKTAQELGITETAIGEIDAMRSAVFDGLLLNSDRNLGNWGQVAHTHLALIDNGRTLISGYPGVSGFAHHRRGQRLTDDHAQRLDSFIGGAHDRLVESVGDHDAMQIVQRARRMIDDAVIVVDT